MPKILVVEDNKDTARMVVKVLEPHGHTVITALNGLDGLKLARTELPDLILMDMDLPDLDGKVVVNQLRAERNFKGTPIIAFTADNSQRCQRLAGLFGCNGFIAKPIDTRKFPAQIANYLTSEVTNEG